jgi:ketosteroid isomerase-like protein
MSAPAAREPEQVDYLLARAFNAGDLDAAVALYEPDASVRRLPEQGGTVATGDEGIREAMAYYVGLQPHMDITVHHVTRSGPIAVLRSQWRITGKTGTGEPILLSHHGIEVVRQQEDGSWKMLIDHPYAADPDWAVEDLPPLPEYAA